MTKQFDPTKPVQTRDGRAARILCIDRKVGRGELGMYTVFALVTTASGGEEAFVYTMDGCYCIGQESVNDLVNVPVKKHGWVNIGRKVRWNPGIAICSNIYETKEAADTSDTAKGRTACIRIEWEE